MSFLNFFLVCTVLASFKFLGRHRREYTRYCTCWLLSLSSYNPPLPNWLPTSCELQFEQLKNSQYTLKKTISIITSHRSRNLFQLQCRNRRCSRHGHVDRRQRHGHECCCIQGKGDLKIFHSYCSKFNRKYLRLCPFAVHFYPPIGKYN